MKKGKYYIPDTANIGKDKIQMKGNPKPHDGTPNLRPPQTKEEAQKRGRAGGIKSGKVRKEKKLMSQIYADILADQAGIKKGKGLKAVVEEILNNSDSKNNSSRVSLMKELREATEGNKIDVTVNNDLVNAIKDLK